MNLWARFVVWSRRRKLRQTWRQAALMLAELRARRAAAADTLALLDRHLPEIEAMMKGALAELSKVEDPQKMLDEALSNDRPL